MLAEVMVETKIKIERERECKSGLSGLLFSV
jgi:hypothetical protein